MMPESNAGPADRLRSAFALNLQDALLDQRGVSDADTLLQAYIARIDAARDLLDRAAAQLKFASNCVNNYAKQVQLAEASESVSAACAFLKRSFNVSPIHPSEKPRS